MLGKEGTEGGRCIACQPPILKPMQQKTTSGTAAVVVVSKTNYLLRWTKPQFLAPGELIASTGALQELHFLLLTELGLRIALRRPLSSKQPNMSGTHAAGDAYCKPHRTQANHGPTAAPICLGGGRGGKPSETNPPPPPPHPPTCITAESRNTAELNAFGRNGPSGITDGSSGLTWPSHSRVTASSDARWAANCPSTEPHAWSPKMCAGGLAVDRRRRGWERLAQ